MRTIPRKAAGREPDYGQDFWDKDEPLPADLAEKMEMLKQFSTKSHDVISRHLRMQSLERNVAILYIEGVVDTVALNQDVIRPLIIYAPKPDHKLMSEDEILEEISLSILTVGQIKKVETSSALLHSLFDGLTVLLIDGVHHALVIDIRGGVIRGINEPMIDRTVCGPREGFHENLVVNLAMIRRKLRDPHLVVEKTTVGKRSRSDVAILYVDDIASPSVVEEIREKINQINMDAILSSGYINQLLESHPYTPFPQERVIERADTAVAELMEGRVVILVNESPLAIVFPALFIEMFQAAEDYYEKTPVGAFWRMFRFLAFIMAVSLPALYIALLSFQPEMLPLTILVTLAESRNKVPFSVFYEVIIMELIIQLVIEAGLRLPTPLGTTIGVVTGIILGQAAISASLASPAMILVIAMTTLSTFSIPNFCMAMATRLVRLPMIALAAGFGIFGFSLGWLLLITHLASLDSMGVPYLSPIAPTRYADLKDTVFTQFTFKMGKRPVSIPHQDDIRQSKQSPEEGNK